MGFDEWESWKETVNILADRPAMKRIRKNVKYFRRGGKGLTLGEVFGD